MTGMKHLYWHDAEIKNTLARKQNKNTVQWKAAQYSEYY